MFCPLCHGSDITDIGSERTMVGDPKGKDVNHVWRRACCNPCNFRFTQERRYNNIWYTHEQRVLVGFPSCFESYIYSCCGCGGSVVREIRDAKGELTTGMSYANGKPLFREFYRCTACELQVEIVHESWKDSLR